MRPPSGHDDVVTSTPAILDDVIGRIAPAPGSDVNQASGDESRDELARLASWWKRLAGGNDPVLASLSCDAAGDAPSFSDGINAANRAIDAGANLLALSQSGHDDVPARAVIAILCHRDAATVTFQANGMSDSHWADRCSRVRDDMARWLPLRGEPWQLAEATGDDGISWMAGVLLAAAARRTPVIVDGVRVLAAAVVADRAASAASSWWRAASTSPDPVYELVRDRIEMARGLPLNVDRADGSAVDSTVALLAVAREH